MLTRRMGLVVVSLLVAGAAVAPSAASAAVPGASAWRENGARDLGAMPARRMTITFAFAVRNPASLKSLVSSPHAALTPAQFTARFGPSTKTVNAIRKWAKAHGLTVSSVSPNRMLVRVSGSSKSIGHALHTSFSLFSSPAGGTYFQITRAVRLPKAFAGKVSALLGLSSLAKVSLPQPAKRSATGLTQVLSTVTNLLPTLGLGTPPVGLGTPTVGLGTPTVGLGGTPTVGLGSTPSVGAPSLNYPASYGPKDFWSIYDAPSTETGSGQQLAIITEGDVSQPEKDLATFEHTYGLPTVTWNQINVGTPTSDTSGDDEWDLDSQYSTGFAPGVTQLDVYVGPSLDDQDIANTIDRWVTDDTSRQGSFSAGECELLSYAGGFTSSLDPILEEADAQGQTMFFSSGDTGSQCPALVGVNGVPAGVPGVNYPASSPYGIGAGGTTLLSPTGPTEIAWYAAGGGSSLIEPTPAFQSSTTVGGVAPLVRRGVPDVSLDADPESGYNVVVDGTVEAVGGTSASAPSWQGIWARAQGAHGGSLGFAGPVIYDTEPASAFHDITLGANGFPALPGWDYASGRGTPDISKFVSGA